MRHMASSLLPRRAGAALRLLPCSPPFLSARFQSGYPPMNDPSSNPHMFHDASMQHNPAARATDSHMSASAGSHSTLTPPTHSQRSSPMSAPHEAQSQQQQQQEEAPRPQKPTTAPRFLKIHTNERNVVNIQFARAPVNSLSLEVLQELNQWLLWLGSNEESRAVVLSSAIPTVFSAGLDLAELSQAQQSSSSQQQQQTERLTSFWQAYQETWLILNTFPKPLIAAITGNSPAAGCVLAMGCDYRVMARGPLRNSSSSSSNNNDAAPRLYRIGLNETKLGLTTPAWVMPAYAYMLGSRQAERMLQLGETPTADEARAMGLIDQVEEDEERTLEAAMQQAERFLAVPQPSRWMVRDMMRREYLQMLSSEEDRNYDTEFMTQMVGSPEVQASLANYLDRLKGKVRK